MIPILVEPTYCITYSPFFLSSQLSRLAPCHYEKTVTTLHQQEIHCQWVVKSTGMSTILGTSDHLFDENAISEVNVRKRVGLARRVIRMLHKT